MVEAGYWQDPKNRKEFFDGLAKEHDFNPRVPDNWYQFTREQKLVNKVCGAFRKDSLTFSSDTKYFAAILQRKN